MGGTQPKQGSHPRMKQTTTAQLSSSDITLHCVRQLQGIAIRVEAERGFDFPSVSPAVIVGVRMSRFFSHFLCPFSMKQSQSDDQEGGALIWGQSHKVVNIAPEVTSCQGCFSAPRRIHMCAKLFSSPLLVFLYVTLFLSLNTKVCLLEMDKSIVAG